MEILCAESAIWQGLHKGQVQTRGCFMEAFDYGQLARLVNRTKSGDSNAFAELYAATYQRQYAYSCRFLRDTHLAEDAIQETYIQVFRNLDKLKDPTLFLAWLGQINFRVCYDIRTKRKSIADNETVLPEQEDLFTDPSQPEHTVLRIDEEQYLMRQVEALPPEESQVIQMKYYQEMTNEEIADATGMSLSTVKRRLKSGRELLHAKLREFR